MQSSFLGYVFLGLHSLFFNQFGSQEINRPLLGRHENNQILTAFGSSLPDGIKYNGAYSLTTLQSNFKNCLKSPNQSDLIENILWLPCEKQRLRDLSQVWEVLPEQLYGEGYFKLQSAWSGKCMEIGSGSKTVTPVHSAKCEDDGELAQNQAFVAHKTKSIMDRQTNRMFTSIQFKHVKSDKCISAPVNTDQGTYISDCADEKDNQWFRFVQEGCGVNGREPCPL